MLELCQYAVKKVKRNKIFISYLHVRDFILIFFHFLSSLTTKWHSTIVSIPVLVVPSRKLHQILRHLGIDFLLHLLFKERVLDLEKNLQYDIVVFLAVLHLDYHVRNAKKIKEHFVNHAVSLHLLHKTTQHAVVVFVGTLELFREGIKLSYL
jgi:hypothetical protein